MSEAERGSGGMWGAVRRHPVLSGTVGGLALVGAILGLAFLSEDWSALRRALAGGVAGAGTGFVIIASRLYD